MVDAVFIDEGTAPGIRTHPTPFDGIRGPNDAESLMSPLSSHGDLVILAENTHNGSDLVGWVTALSKDDYSVVTPPIGIGSQSWPTGTNSTAVAGHASGASGVSGDGYIFARRGGHTDPLDAFATTAPDNLATISALANPTGTDVRADYRRTFRDVNGVLWIYMRGNDGKGELFRLDGPGHALTRVGAPFADFGASNGHYGLKLACTSTGVLYGSFEVLLGLTSGFPNSVVGVIKSVDGGTTWTNLSDVPITLPLTQAQMTLLAGGSGSDQVIMPNIGIGPNDEPVITFGWTNSAESDTFLATYVARWNSTTDTWSMVRLYPSIGVGGDETAERAQWQNSKIIPHTLHQNGNILIVMKEIGIGVTQRLVALVNYAGEPDTDWHRWVLQNDDLYTGAYVDYNAIEDDQKIRVYPVTSGDLVPYDQRSEIWEFAIPGFDVWGDGIQVDDIVPTSYNDVAVAEGTSYRYRVRASDSVSGLSSDWSDWVLVTVPFAGMTAEVAHGITLGHAAVADTSMSVSIGHGITLGHAAVATITEGEEVLVGVSHGIVLSHQGVAQLDSGGSIAHGVVLGHSVTAAVTIDVTATITHGIVLGHQMTAVLPQPSGVGRPIQPLAPARPIQPMMGG